MCRNGMPKIEYVQKKKLYDCTNMLYNSDGLPLHLENYFSIFCFKTICNEVSFIKN